MGRLTRDPELRYTPAGTAIVSFGMAITRKFKTAEGEQKDEVCFVDVNMFGRRAEVISEYFSKGTPIFVEGRLQFQQWESQEGQKRNKLIVIAENFEFVGGTNKKIENDIVEPQVNVHPDNPIPKGKDRVDSNETPF